MFTIRFERPEDFSSIREINEQAFGRKAESKLVEALRFRGTVVASLVAEMNGHVVGHILFSPVLIEPSGQRLAAVGLAPMAILAKHQRQGIGSALVKRGLEECQNLDQDLAVVLGHPNYYPRFGFAPANQWRLRCEYDVSEDTFMAKELRPRALENVAGTVKYQPEFSEL